MKPIKISDHARRKMMLRRVSIDEVLKVRQYPQCTDLQGNTRRYYLGNLCLVVAEDRKSDTVKTILFRVNGRWTDEDVRNR